MLVVPSGWLLHAGGGGEDGGARSRSKTFGRSTSTTRGCPPPRREGGGPLHPLQISATISHQQCAHSIHWPLRRADDTRTHHQQLSSLSPQFTCTHLYTAHISLLNSLHTPRKISFLLASLPAREELAARRRPIPREYVRGHQLTALLHHTCTPHSGTAAVRLALCALCVSPAPSYRAIP